MTSSNYIQFTGGLNARPRAVKQLCGVERFMVRTSEAIRTYFFCSIRAFTQLELMRVEELIENWYEVQHSLYIEVVREFILKHLKKQGGRDKHYQLSVNA